MNIKAFKEDRISSYKIRFGEHNIMLDFNGANLKPEDVKDIDLIFISHEHLDHFKSLLDYDLVKFLKKDVRLFATKTTILIIKHIAEERMEKSGYTKAAKKCVTDLFNKFEPLLFNEVYKIDDNLSVQLFRSGHTFGSSMIYLMSNETLLYTGDIDYIAKDPYRQYSLPYNMKVDYLITEGTNFGKDNNRGTILNNIVDYINRQKKNVPIEYYARPEKAIFYARALSQKMDNIVCIISYDYLWYIKILFEQGYGAFVEDKVVLDLGKKYPNKKNVIFKPNAQKFNVDTRLSLHYDLIDFINMVNEHLSNEPKIYIGHYDDDKKDQISIPEFEHVVVLKEGENNE